MFWILVIAAFAAVAMWAFFATPYTYWKDMGVPQSSPCFLFGDEWPTLLRRKNILEWINWLYWVHPESKYVGFYKYFTPIFLAKDPEVITQLTVKDFDHFTDNNCLVDPDADPLWSNNLFALKGLRWRDVRTLLSGAFTSSKMRVMYGVIREEAEKFADHYKLKNVDLVELEIKDSFLRSIRQ